MNFNKIPPVTSYDDSYSSLYLYNEDGNMLKDFGYAYMFSPSLHKVSNNKCRLAILRYKFTTQIYETDIYSLPGTYNAGVSEQQIVINSNSNPVIYPNPAKTSVFVECEPFSVVKFYDASGKEVLTQNANGKTEININYLPAGIYFVQVVLDGRIVGSSKIVKQ